MRIAICLWLLAASAAAQTGAVSGRVVSKQTGAPVRGAVVFATQATRERGSAWTGADGRFRIGNLPPGMHQIIIVKPAMGGANRAAEVRAGEETSGVDLALDGPTVVAGKIVDADGLPVEGAVIQARGLSWYFGRPSLIDAPTVESDDLGEFRFSPRQPGPLFLSVEPPVQPGVSGAYRLLHPPMFHPNALHPAEAQPVNVQTGVKIENLDFEVPPTVKTRLRILARAGEGGQQARSCVRCQFRIAARNGLLWLPVLSGQTNGDGRAEIEGLQPGVYRITVAGEAGDTVYAGYTDTAVDERQPRAEEVIAYAPGEAPVQVTLVDPPEEVRSESSGWSARLGAALIEPEYPLEADSGELGENITGSGVVGRGSLHLTPGDWALHLYQPPGLSPGAYVSEVLAAGRVQSGPIIRVPQNGLAPRIEVRIGFATSKVTGTVKGLPAFDPVRDRRIAFVFAIPDADGYGRREEVPVMRAGRFEFQRLAPGNYLLFALPAGGYSFQLDLGDPAVQQRYASYGKRITASPGENLEVDLEAIP